MTPLWRPLARLAEVAMGQGRHGRYRFTGGAGWQLRGASDAYSD